MAQAKDDSSSKEFEAVEALRAKDMDAFRMLLLDDLDVNKLCNYSKKSSEKETLLHIAIKAKNLKAVESLVKFKADINKQSFPSGNTPLHIAAQYAEDEIVKFLLDKGADSVTNNNKGKNPLQVIGEKLSKDKNSAINIHKTTETQILLLSAGGKKAEKFQTELNEDLADAETGLKGLKMVANDKVNSVAKAQQKNFDSTHPYLKIKSDRLRVWEQNNKTTLRDFLHKRYIKIHVPRWEHKGTTHIDLSKTQTFQVTMAITMLEKNGLKLIPEPYPGKPPKGAKIHKDESQTAKKAKAKK